MQGVFIIVENSIRIRTFVTISTYEIFSQYSEKPFTNESLVFQFLVGIGHKEPERCPPQKSIL